MSDSHYFPPGRSMARRVHGERSVGLLYGQRALLIGALEPLTFFDLVTAAEKPRGGTPTPALTHRTASNFHPAR